MPFTHFLQKFQFGAGRGWISVKDRSIGAATDGWVAEHPKPGRGGGASPTAGVLGLGGLGLQVEAWLLTHLPALPVGAMGLEAVRDGEDIWQLIVEVQMSTEVSRKGGGGFYKARRSGLSSGIRNQLEDEPLSCLWTGFHGSSASCTKGQMSHCSHHPCGQSQIFVSIFTHCTCSPCARSVPISAWSRQRLSSGHRCSQVQAALPIMAG